MLSDVDGKSRLAHGRTRRQHHQIARLQAGCHLVQIVEAGGHTGDVVGVVGHLLHAVEQVHHQRIHRLETLLHARAFFADVEDLLLGLVQDLVHRPALGVEGSGSDLVAGCHQLAQDGALAHDLGVAADVAGTGHVLRQRVQVTQTTRGIGMALVLQLLEDRDHIGRFGGVDQRTNGSVDQLVLMAVKVTVDQQIPHPIPCAVVEQQTTEHAGFGFDGVRRHTQLGHLLVGREINGQFVQVIGIDSRHGKNSKTASYPARTAASWDKAVDKRCGYSGDGGKTAPRKEKAASPRGWRLFGRDADQAVSP